MLLITVNQKHIHIDQLTTIITLDTLGMVDTLDMLVMEAALILTPHLLTHMVDIKVLTHTVAIKTAILILHTKILTHHIHTNHHTDPVTQIHTLLATVEASLEKNWTTLAQLLSTKSTSVIETKPLPIKRQIQFNFLTEVFSRESELSLLTISSMHLLVEAMLLFQMLENVLKNAVKVSGSKNAALQLPCTDNKIK